MILPHLLAFLIAVFFYCSIIWCFECGWKIHFQTIKDSLFSIKIFFSGVLVISFLYVVAKTISETKVLRFLFIIFFFFLSPLLMKKKGYSVQTS